MGYYASFQDILFVLAGLAWIAYSAYRTNKKRGSSAASGQPKKTAEKSSLFEELLEQYTQTAGMQRKTNLDVKDFDVATKPRQTESSLDTVQQFNTVQQFTDADIYEEGESEIKLAKQTALDGTQIHNVNVDAFSLKKQSSNRTFNLKRAFIYSEILNQKYI